MACVDKKNVLGIIFIFSLLSYGIPDGNLLTNGQSNKSNSGNKEINLIINQNTVIENQNLEYYQIDTIIIENSELINSSITIYESSSIIIRNNTFLNPPNQVITIFSSTNISITKNRFVEVPETAISVLDSELANIRGNEITLSDEDQGLYASYVSLRVERTQYVEILENEMNSPLGDGMHIFYSDHVLVENNNVSNVGFTSLAISSSPNTIIQKNRLINSSSYSRLVQGNDIPQSSALTIVSSPEAIISENLIDYSDYTGVELISSRNGQVINNSIRNHPTGVFIGLSPNTIINNNEFYDVQNPILIDQSSGVITNSNTIIYDRISPDETDTAYIGLLSVIIGIFVLLIFRIKIYRR